MRRCHADHDDPPAEGLFKGFGWLPDFGLPPWPMCPAAMAPHRDPEIRITAERVQQLAVLLDAGLSPRSLSAAGERWIALAKGYNERCKIEHAEWVRSQKEPKS